MYELAHVDPYQLNAELGLMGQQLFALAWGIDRSQLRKRRGPKNASLGNSQVLPRDYVQQVEIETVIKEVGEQVAARLRHHHKLAGCISLGVGFSYAASEADGRSGFHQELRIAPTDQNAVISQALLRIFHQHWQGQAIRNLAVYTSRLSPATGLQLNFF